MHNRREFLASVAGAAGGLAVKSASGTGTAAEWRNRVEGMAYRRLGRTNFMVSEVVMGGVPIEKNQFEHVLRAVDRGLNYLDTAPAYGQGKSEEGFARVIKACGREKVFLTTKVSQWDLNRNQIYQDIFDSLSASDQEKLKNRVSEEIERRGVARPDHLVNYFSGQLEELESAELCNLMEKEFGHRIDRKKNYKQVILNSIDESLSRLGTDYVDIMMCPHGASSQYEMENYPETREAFEILKKAGKVRHLGVSAHTDPGGILEAAVEAEVYSVAMVAYNIVNHHYVDSALQRAFKKDLGIIAMKVARPVHPGVNRGAADPRRVELIEKAVEGPWTVPQKAYLWALRNPNLSAVVSAMEDMKMVEANLSLAGASGG